MKYTDNQLLTSKFTDKIFLPKEDLKKNNKTFDQMNNQSSCLNVTYSRQQQLSYSTPIHNQLNNNRYDEASYFLLGVSQTGQKWIWTIQLVQYNSLSLSHHHIHHAFRPCYVHSICLGSMIICKTDESLVYCKEQQNKCRQTFSLSQYPHIHTCNIDLWFQ